MGVSFAWLAAERGYRCVIVMPSNMSEERKKTMSFYGAELIEVPAGEFDTAIGLRDRLARENGWFNCNQFDNQLNVESHKKTTAAEILKDVGYDSDDYKVIEAFVTGTGTGGTLMGAGVEVKKYVPYTKIIAVEPDESPVMSGGEPGLHGIQGIGDGSKFLVDMNEVNQVIRIKTEDAKKRALRLSKEMGIFVGISAGANILASEKWVEENNPEGIVVTFLCDRGDRYFSCL
jgi:cysteine synthase A